MYQVHICFKEGLYSQFHVKNIQIKDNILRLEDSIFLSKSYIVLFYWTCVYVAAGGNKNLI